MNDKRENLRAPEALTKPKESWLLSMLGCITGGIVGIAAIWYAIQFIIWGIFNYPFLTGAVLFVVAGLAVRLRNELRMTAQATPREGGPEAYTSEEWHSPR